MEATQRVPLAPTVTEPEFIERFDVRQRVEHVLLMVVFIALAVTGLIQRFYTAGISEWLILHLGGIEMTRLIHRIFGLIMVLTLVYHFAYVNYVFFVKHGRLTMAPNLKDFRDVINALKRGFGFKAPEPKYGRFDYRQKFEYVGFLVGSVIITVSGFFLAFPILVTRVLPGQFVAAAVEFHGYEATLAILTIIIWHLYDVMLKPGIFPADTSIFTGRMSRHRMEEEHALELANLERKTHLTAGTTPAAERATAETETGTAPEPEHRSRKQ